MSSENVELVRALQPADVDLVDVFVRGNLASLDMDPALFESEFEVRFLAGIDGWDQPTYRGVEGLLEGWREWLLPWASYRISVEEYLDAGDQVVVAIRVHGETARDGVSVEHAPAAIWTIRDGKVAGIRFYLDRKEALEAAGLTG